MDEFLFSDDDPYKNNYLDVNIPGLEKDGKCYHCNNYIQTFNWKVGIMVVAWI